MSLSNDGSGNSACNSHLPGQRAKRFRTSRIQHLPLSFLIWGVWKDRGKDMCCSEKFEAAWSSGYLSLFMPAPARRKHQAEAIRSMERRIYKREGRRADGDGAAPWSHPRMSPHRKCRKSRRFERTPLHVAPQEESEIGPILGATAALPHALTILQIESDIRVSDRELTIRRIACQRTRARDTRIAAILHGPSPCSKHRLLHLHPRWWIRGQIFLGK